GQILEVIARESGDPRAAEQADRAFHLAIARATRNAAVHDAIEQLWDLRDKSPEAALLHEKARNAHGSPVVEEHMAVLSALQQRDPTAARAAMRADLAAVLDALLFAIEEKALAEARRVMEEKRRRYSA